MKYKRDQIEHDDTGEPTQVRLTPTEYKILLTAFQPEDRPSSRCSRRPAPDGPKRPR
ncbi:hypothetical protein NKG94_34705 [Micromonospora sp. M12]